MFSTTPRRIEPTPDPPKRGKSSSFGRKRTPATNNSTAVQQGVGEESHQSAKKNPSVFRSITTPPSSSQQAKERPLSSSQEQHAEKKRKKLVVSEYQLDDYEQAFHQHQHAVTEHGVVTAIRRPLVSSFDDRGGQTEKNNSNDKEGGNLLVPLPQQQRRQMDDGEGKAAITEGIKEETRNSRGVKAKRGKTTTLLTTSLEDMIAEDEAEDAMQRKQQEAMQGLFHDIIDNYSDLTANSSFLKNLVQFFKAKHHLTTNGGGEKDVTKGEEGEKDSKLSTLDLVIRPPPSQVPSKYWVLETSPLLTTSRYSMFDEQSRKFLEVVFPSETSTSRREVYQLAATMDTLLKQIHVPTAPTARQNKKAGEEIEMGIEEATEPSSYNKRKKYSPPSSQDRHEIRKQIISITMMGWTEIIRQCYGHIAEQGLLLDKIRIAFFSILQGALEEVDIYKEKLEEIEHFDVESRLMAMTEEAVAKNVKIGALQRENEELKATIASFDNVIAEVEHLREREAFLNEFIARQNTRNAQILELQEAAINASNEAAGGKTKDGKKTVGGAAGNMVKKTATTVVTNATTATTTTTLGKKQSTLSSKSSTLDGSKLTSIKTGGGEDEGLKSASSLLEKNAALLQQQQNAEDEVEEVEEITTATACFQVDMDYMDDEKIYVESSSLLKYMDHLIEGTDELCKSFYAGASISNPSQHVNYALARLEEISQRAIEAAERNNPSGRVLTPQQKSNITARGIYRIGKQSIASLLSDGAEALKEICLRVAALKNHIGLKERLTPMMRAPTHFTEPCPLCNRMGEDPLHTVKQKQEFEKLQSTINNLKEDVTSLTAKHEQDKGEVKRLRHQNRGFEEEIAKRDKEKMAGKLEKAFVNGSCQTETHHGNNNNNGGSSPMSSSAHSSKMKKHEHDPSRSPLLLSPDDRGGHSSAASPLEIKLVINCHCSSTSSGKASSPSSTTNRAHPQSQELRGAPMTGGQQKGPTVGAPPHLLNPETLSQRRGSSTGTPPSATTNSQQQEASTWGDDEPLEITSSMTANEKKRTEIALRIRQLVKMQESNAPPKHVHWLVKHMLVIYRSKYKLDVSMLSEKYSVLTCPEHLADYLRQTYGTRKLVEEGMTSLLNTTRRFASEDPRVMLFSKFVSEAFSKHCYKTFIRFFKMLDDSVPLFDPKDAKPGDEDRTPSDVPLDAIIHALLSTLKTKNCLLELISLANKLSRLVEDTKKRDFKSLAQAIGSGTGGGSTPASSPSLATSGNSASFRRLSTVPGSLPLPQAMLNLIGLNTVMEHASSTGATNVSTAIQEYGEVLANSLPPDSTHRLVNRGLFSLQMCEMCDDWERTDVSMLEDRGFLVPGDPGGSTSEIDQQQAKWYARKSFSYFGGTPQLKPGRKVSGELDTPTTKVVAEESGQVKGEGEKSLQQEHQQQPLPTVQDPDEKEMSYMIPAQQQVGGLAIASAGTTSGSAASAHTPEIPFMFLKTGHTDMRSHSAELHDEEDGNEAIEKS